MVHLYELRNADNTVEYVGVSVNLKQRLYSHTKRKPNGTARQGLFYGREDLTQHVIKTFLNRSEAMRAETVHKIELGFEPTESNNGKRSGNIVYANSKGIFGMDAEHKKNAEKKGGQIAGLKNWKALQKIGKCIHCNAEMNLGNLTRFHNNNCKWKQ